MLRCLWLSVWNVADATQFSHGSKAHALTAGTDVNLRDLAAIARDRSAAGRAKLFALLAGLLVSRWQSLTSNERTQLADLVALLWPRGATADRDRLRNDLAGRPDIPAVLLPVLQPAPGEKALLTAPLLPPESAMGAVTPKLSLAKKSIKHTVSNLAVIRRRQPSPPQAATEPQAATGVSPAVAPKPDSGSTDSRPVVSEASMPSAMNGQARPVASGAANPEPMPAVSSPPASPSPANPPPPLLAPRENPHRLTPDHLTESLAGGDLARFEVMLAHLTRLRTPLLRRLLQDSGNESLAILARSIGLDPEAFQRQWQGWRQQTAQIEPGARLPDRHEAQRIETFFSALGDGQVDRLMQRWRSDGDRLFPGTSTAQ